MQRSVRVATLALASLLLTQTASAADPTGVWRFDPKALDAIGDRIAAAMAAELTPGRRREMLTQARDKEVELGKLEKEAPEKVAQLMPELRRARAMARIAADPKTYFKREFLASLGDPAQTGFEFEDDGTLVYSTVLAGRPQRSEGAWKSEDEQVEIVASLPAPGGGVTYLHARGPLKAERMELTYAGTAEDEAKLLAENPEIAKAMREATWVLVRQP